MANDSSSQAIKRSPRRVKQQQPKPSSRMVAFAIGWLFGWPLLVFAYNPLTAPHDPLTLFIVVPGGAIWLFLFIYFYCYFYDTQAALIISETDVMRHR